MRSRLDGSRIGVVVRPCELCGLSTATTRRPTECDTCWISRTFGLGYSVSSVVRQAHDLDVKPASHLRRRHAAEDAKAQGWSQKHSPTTRSIERGRVVDAVTEAAECVPSNPQRREAIEQDADALLAANPHVVTETCWAEDCDATFTRNPRGRRRKFCSDRCSARDRQRRRRDELADIAEQIAEARKHLCVRIPPLELKEASR